MIKAAVLVPAPDYPEDWRWAYDGEAAALARAEMTTIEPFVAFHEGLAWVAQLDGVSSVIPGATFMSRNQGVPPSSTMRSVRDR